MYRLCWVGLDKWTSEKQMAKFLSDLPVQLIGMFKPKRKSYAFLTFGSESDKDKLVELVADIGTFRGK
jgi:hypothetical protein